jgi:hypothetical protein
MRDLEDFLRLLERQSVVKALAWDGSELVGVGFLTNELDMVPGISSEFFRPATRPKRPQEHCGT